MTITQWLLLALSVAAFSVVRGRCRPRAEEVEGGACFGLLRTGRGYSA
jgi:hypothetical protein